MTGWAGIFINVLTFECAQGTSTLPPPPLPQTKLDLDPMVEKVLTESPLTGSSHLRDCTQAALTLQAAISQELSQGVSILQAVTEQKQFFSNLSFTFGRRLHEALSGMFVSQVRTV